MRTLILLPGRDRSVRRRHPWLMSGAVARVEGAAAPEAGQDAAAAAEDATLCRVVSAEGETLGFGDLSPQSQIRLRMISPGKEAPAPGWLGERIERAVRLRREDPRLSDTDACRLIHAEGDGLPGLVADRYADSVVVRASSLAMHARIEAIAAALRAATGAAHGVERADATAARREGFAIRQGPLWGAEPAGPIEIREGARRHLVDVVHGQKTGFYLDQRDARDLVQSLAAGRRVLDLYAYTGGFSVAAKVGGARAIDAVDSSADALALARETLARNASPPGAAEPALRFVEADAHRFVREAGEPFDLIVVDPPPLARRSGDVERAARAHKDVLLFALKRAAPDAHVLAFSCSHAIDARLLRQIVWSASLDAGRPAQVLRELGAPSDHPVSLDHPEGQYLHGLWLRLVS